MEDSVDSVGDAGGSGDSGGFFTRDRVLLLVVVVSGIVLPGVARWYLGEAGYSGVGTVVFALGYAGMVFLVWFGWIRPLEITGPRTRGDAPTGDEPSSTGDQRTER